MIQKERALVTALVLLLLVLWAGFLVHRSPRFPGSLWGGVLAVAGAAPMVLFSIGYAAIKRIPWLKAAVNRRIPMRTLLAWHVYSAAFGAILLLLHTGHKFQSVLGIALTAALLLAILSGYIGRHFLNMVSLELNEKRELLRGLQSAYEATARELTAQPAAALAMTSSGRLFAKVLGQPPLEKILIPDPVGSISTHAVRLADSMADVEYAIKMDELLRRRSSRWLKIHMVVSYALLALLFLHVWASVYFGLRWFR